MIFRFTPYPFVMKVFSCAGSCTIIMSASPLMAACIAAPVPCAWKLTVIQGYFAWKADFMLPVPVSSSPVSHRLVVVEIVNVVGLGIGVGDGEGLGLGVGEGDGEGLGDGEVPGLGEGVGLADGDGVGVGVG